MVYFPSFACGCLVFPTPFIEETIFSPLYVLGTFVADFFCTLSCGAASLLTGFTGFLCILSCGACRVKVGNEVKFACIDGPEFDGHLVDFDQAMQRQRMYKTEEGRRYLAEQEGKSHHGGCGHCE